MYDIYPPPYGTIEVICGSMYSGKTTHLIELARRFDRAQLNVQVFKPKLDNRYDSDALVSHNQGESYPGLAIEGIEEMRAALSPDTNVVIFDEIQFFPLSVIDLILELTDRGIRIIVAGLDLDFQMKPFEVMATLMAYADSVTKLKAVCSKCLQRPGVRSFRLVNQGERILIGAEGVYEARCRTCYNEGMRQNRS